MIPYLLHHFLEQGADHAPENPLCLYEAQTASYGEIDSRANKLARALRSLGVTRGDRVALLIENSSNYIAAYYGTLKAGAVTVGIFTTTTEKNLEFVLNDCEVKVLITQSKHLGLVDSLHDRLSKLRGLIITDKASPPRPWPEAVLNPSDVDDHPDQRPGLNMIDLDLASIVYTSGSTGNPRGATLSHLNLVTNTRSIVSYLKLTAADRIMVVLPFPYVYGKSLLNTHVAVGGSVLIDNRMVFPNLILKTMQQHEATGFSGVPSTFAVLLGKSSVRKMAPSSPTATPVLPSLKNTANRGLSTPLFCLVQVRPRSVV